MLGLKLNHVSKRGSRRCGNAWTSSNGSICMVTGGFSSQRLVIRTFDVFRSAPEQTVEQTIKTPVILRRHCTHYDVTVMGVNVVSNAWFDIENVNFCTHVISMYMSEMKHLTIFIPKLNCLLIMMRSNASVHVWVCVYVHVCAPLSHKWNA